MSDASIHHQISELVGTERDLRDRFAAGQISEQEEHQQLADVEAALDQAWDLLRQRDALRAVGKDPETATQRPVSEVEGYVD